MSDEFSEEEIDKEYETTNIQQLCKVIRIGEDITSITIDAKQRKKLTPFIQQKEIKTNDFLENCNQLFNNSTNHVEFVLQQKCKFVKQYSPRVDRQNFLFVIEEEPCVRTLRVNLSMVAPLERLKLENKLEEYGYSNFQLKEYGEPYYFTVAFPYVVHALILMLQPDSQPKFYHSVYYRLEPLKSTFDYLLKPNLPNVDPSYRVCAGQYTISETSIPGMVNEYLIHFWSSIFNKDYTTNYIAYADEPIITDFLQWQYHSKKDSRCIFNVEWKSIGNLSGQVEKFERDHQLEEDKYIDLDRLYQLASGLKVTFNKEKPQICFSNWIDTLWLDHYLLTIGDKFQIKKKEFYIKDFLRGTGPNSFIVLENKNGKTINVKDTKKFRNFLSREFANKRITKELIINGETFVSKETIVYTSPGNITKYATIDSFIKNKSGQQLIMLNDGKKYFLDSIKIQKFNPFSITIDGVKFEVNKKYYVLMKYPLYVSTYREMIFKKAYLDYGELKLEFLSSESSNRRDHIFDSYELSRYIIVSDTHPSISFIPTVFSFSKVYQTTNGFLCYDNNIYIKKDGSLKPASFYELIKYVNENEFKIPSLKPFKVGDQIAIALWKEPLEMIKRRVITKFIIDNEKESVYIETNDGEKNRIDPIIVNEYILYSNFKHIETEYEDLKAGMVVKPSRAGISCFPKKSNYRIIGFIYNNFCPIPMVLMSNCCTLWPFQIKDHFSLTQNINVENPDIEKIKIKDLDMFHSDKTKICDKYADTILLHNRQYAGVRVYDINDVRLTGNYASSVLPESNKRIGFIYPRRNQNEEHELRFGTISGDYNIHFLNQAHSKSIYKFFFQRGLLKTNV